METMTTTTQKTRSIRYNNPVLIYINKDIHLMLSKVFVFEGSEDNFIGHLKLWDNNAPFYFVFKKEHMQNLLMKGYRDCMFIPNNFRIKYDKKGKMFLALVDENITHQLIYYSIKSISDLRKLVKERNLNRHIYAGFKEPVNGNISILGEAIEIAKTYNHE